MLYNFVQDNDSGNGIRLGSPLPPSSSPLPLVGHSAPLGLVPYPSSFPSNKTYTKRDMSLALEALRYTFSHLITNIEITS